jgi:sensor histidine kinase regulating citrate/malate metabolism
VSYSSQKLEDAAHERLNESPYVSVLIAIVAVTQTWFMKRYGAKYMMAMVIGEYCEP